MKPTLLRQFVFEFPLLLICSCSLLNITFAAPWDPAAADYAGHKGKTIYVSKLGDDSDGSTWQKAFRTIQAALLAVPDDNGGHCLVVRPDTYVEANLYATHKGAAGAYNLLMGDCDGHLGSGTIGWVIIDSGDPEKGGFKSYDWWSTVRATKKGWSPEHTAPTFSSIAWDRWMLRNLYATGSDAGFFWDLTDKSGEQFTVIVEDSVGIGRAFGGGLGHPVVRENEPTTFRRCYLASLDWWGDAGALAVGAYNASPPSQPDVVCEDCTLVSPDNAVQIVYENKFIRLKLKKCRLITLNFSQPVGTPSTGIISSNVGSPDQVHVDFEDCTLMGYQVFGTGNPAVNRAPPSKTGGEIRYTTKGNVRAYVQFQQPVPKGFERMTRWPAEIFDQISPPKIDGAIQSPPIKKLTKLPEILSREHEMECTPIVHKGRRLMFRSHRVDRPKPDLKQMYLSITDEATGKEICRFGERHTLGSAFVDGETVHVFAADHGGTVEQWCRDIDHFSSTDLKRWKCELAIPREGKEHLLNTSVCRDELGYVMAYESDRPLAFCFKFARSKDVVHWTKIDRLAFAGPSGKEYSACPVIRYVKPYYYVIYVPAPLANPHRFVAYMARSKDLAAWQLSPRNPVLEPGEGEWCNTSDVDLIELDGKTYVNYAVGNQDDICQLRRAVFPGPLREFFEGYFPEGAALTEVNARTASSSGGR